MLKPPERKYSTFDRKLIAVFLTNKHFCHFLEARQFSVLNDHGPLTFALSTHADSPSPHTLRKFSYILQFTNDIWRIKGIVNLVADPLSHIAVIGVVFYQHTGYQF